MIVLEFIFVVAGAGLIWCVVAIGGDILERRREEREQREAEAQRMFGSSGKEEH